jgi:hypothetical protein
MSRSLFSLLPGKGIAEDSTTRDHDIITSAYTVLITNTRLISRFDGMGSYPGNALFSHDVLDAGITRRLFVHYLVLKTKRKDFSHKKIKNFLISLSCCIQTTFCQKKNLRKRSASLTPSHTMRMQGINRSREYLFNGFAWSASHGCFHNLSMCTYDVITGTYCVAGVHRYPYTMSI